MPLTGIQHLLVLSDDIEATRDFYRDVLGLREGERPPLEFPGFWLYLGGEPCLHIADRGAYAAHASTLGLDVAVAAGDGGPIDHVAFAAENYEETAARLQRVGIEAVENKVPAAGLRQLFVEDPNGLRVEMNFVR
jgi:catechol 2,3-dioxygenase-like lactoylglutathione lyase family enzyme